MKNLLLLLCIVAVAGCAKTNEDIAKDLIQEKLKATLPDFENYEPVNHGRIGKAFLPFEESDQYVNNKKEIKILSDSIAVLQQLISDKKPGTTGETELDYTKRMQQLQNSITAKNDAINSAKQAYTPESLYRLTHTYKVKDKSGVEKTTEEAFYFDEALTKVVKVVKVNS